MAAPAPQPYKRVGQYDLYHVIGQGSFASVYRGEHRPTRRVVAIKAIVRARLNRKLQVRTYRPDRFYLFHSRQHHHRTPQTHAPLSNKQLTSDVRIPSIQSIHRRISRRKSPSCSLRSTRT